MRRLDALFSDEEGFTTTSMVLSLLITLSLLFTAAQVYRIQSAAAEVQDVADAAALSAETQVAEFMIVARYCDAIVLSLSLASVATAGLGVVALCTPATAKLSEGLVKASKTLVKARNTFSTRAAAALDKIQSALPYFAAACAMSVSAANNGDSSGANYLGVAMLVPAEGKKLKIESDDKAEELVDDVDENADEIREKAEKAEKAAQEANESKQRAYERDCGANPGRCLYERASKLANMAGTDNPYYASVDSWTFRVALDRARAYYRTRSLNDQATGNSVKQQGQSELRKRFYGYAANLLAQGYVHETESSFEAYFPLPPKNTAEIRETTLYTERAYPVTAEVTETESQTELEGETVTTVTTETKYTMHAWSGCPNATAAHSYGSIEEMEAGDYETCPLCEFEVASMGNIASATSNNPTGFEYHYRAIAEEAKTYEQARKEAEEPKRDVKNEVNRLLDELKTALKKSADARIFAEPPGRYGAIAFVVNAGTTSAAGGFASKFVTSNGSLGPRAAVSGATLVDEGTSEGKSVLNSALDNLKEGGGVLAGAAGLVLDLWSMLIVAYSDGQKAITGAIRNGLNGLPLVGASGLGTWAAEKLEAAIAAAGLQPAEMGALKPCLVNSGHVASAGDGQAANFMVVKKQVIAHPAMSTDLFSSALSEAERMAVDQIDKVGDSIQIASIELVEGGLSIPITIPIPDSAKQFGVDAIRELIGRVRSFYIETTGVRVWE